MRNTKRRRMFALLCVVILSVTNVLFCLVFGLGLGERHPIFWRIAYLINYSWEFFWVCYFAKDPCFVTGHDVDTQLYYLYGVLLAEPIANTLFCNQIGQGGIIFYMAIFANLSALVFAWFKVCKIYELHQNCAKRSERGLRQIRFQEAVVIGGGTVFTALVTISLLVVLRYTIGVCVLVLGSVSILLLNKRKYGNIKDDSAFTFRKVVIADSAMQMLAFLWALLFSFFLMVKKQVEQFILIGLAFFWGPSYLVHH